MKIRIFFILLLSGYLWSCNTNTKEPESTDTPTDQVAEQAINTNNRATIEDFWTTFQLAVADQDIETLETLYAPDVVKYKFTDPVYQEKIAAGLMTDIKETGEMYQGGKVYQFAMVFPPPPSNDESIEESQTTIYMRKNTAGLYEIFYVIEAG